MRKIHVDVSKPYDVLIGRGLIKEVPDLIKSILAGKQIAIISDDIVFELYLRQLEYDLEENGYTVFSFSFPNGEQSKNIKTLSDILEFLAEKNIRRNDTVIALGGGVVGDIAGLSAALYMRGIQVIQIPTTLLSAVDSSVGGKTAVDLNNGKNLVGAFWQPSMVICDVDIIDKLPDDIFAEGMAEVIKCNVIKELPIFNWIKEDSVKEHLDEIIYDCVDLKKEIVEQDVFDNKGIRNILNVGHTIGHAIEKLSGYSISHGKAIGTGLLVEAKLAEKLGICKEKTRKKICNMVKKYKLLVDIPWSSEEIVTVLKSDKKNKDMKIVFVLPYNIGKCKEISIDEERIKMIIENTFRVNEF